MSRDEGTFLDDVYGLTYPGRCRASRDLPPFDTVAETPTRPPARNGCTCQCHQPGVIMRHMAACC